VHNSKISALAIACIMGAWACAQQAASNPAASSTGLTASSVVAMVKGGLGDDVIIARIGKEPNAIQVTPEDMAKLQQANVSDRVLQAMTEPKSVETGAATKPAQTVADPGPAVTRTAAAANNVQPVRDATGVTRSPAPGAKSASTGLTAGGVVAMVKGGLGDDVIMTRIRKEPNAIPVTPEEMAQLQQANVSDRVLRAMADPKAVETVASPRPVQVAAQPGQTVAALPVVARTAFATDNAQPSQDVPAVARSSGGSIAKPANAGGGTSRGAAVGQTALVAGSKALEVMSSQPAQLVIAHIPVVGGVASILMKTAVPAAQGTPAAGGKLGAAAAIAGHLPGGNIAAATLGATEGTPAAGGKLGAAAAIAGHVPGGAAAAAVMGAQGTAAEGTQTRAGQTAAIAMEVAKHVPVVGPAVPLAKAALETKTGGKVMSAVANKLKKTTPQYHPASAQPASTQPASTQTASTQHQSTQHQSTQPQSTQPQPAESTKPASAERK